LIRPIDVAVAPVNPPTSRRKSISEQPVIAQKKTGRKLK